VASVRALAHVGHFQNTPRVSFSDYTHAVPPWIRLLLAIAVSVVAVVLLIGFLHRHILAINAAPTKAKDDDPDPPPGIKDIAGRLIALATFAFVFLLGFGFAQFWSTAKDARDAVLSEATDFQRAVTLAQDLPQGQSAAVVDALDAYRTRIVDVEWPLMRSADSVNLVQERYASGDALLKAIKEARPSDASSSPVWANLDSTIGDLLDDAVDRTNAIPSPMAVSIIIIVIVLGLVNLLAIAAFQPASRRAHLLMVAAMAALTAFLVFSLVEISNPYVGAGSIIPSLTPP
jgi:hypothetical protein